MENGKLMQKCIRITAISIVILLLLIYVTSIVIGLVPNENRLGTPEIFLVVLLVLVFSGFFNNISEFTLGPFFSAKLRELTKTQAQQTNTLENQQEELSLIRLLVLTQISEPEKDKLKGLSKEGPFMCWFKDDLYDEIKQLDSRRFVQPSPENNDGLNKIKKYKDKPEEFDLKKIVTITQKGIEYLKILDKFENLPKN
jgi:hypothetical protein